MFFHEFTKGNNMNSCFFLWKMQIFVWVTLFQGTYVREMSGKFKIFQGQGIVREFHNLSGKIEFLLKCQGNVREF